MTDEERKRALLPTLAKDTMQLVGVTKDGQPIHKRFTEIDPGLIGVETLLYGLEIRGNLYFIDGKPVSEEDYISALKEAAEQGSQLRREIGME